MFWLVPENLPENITIEKTDSEIDQECHYDIFGFNKNRSRTFFKTQTKEWKGFFYCEDNEVELTLETAKTFYE